MLYMYVSCGSAADTSPGESSQDLPARGASVTGGTGHKGLSKGAVAGSTLAAVVGSLWVALAFVLVKKKLRHTNPNG